MAKIEKNRDSIDISDDFFHKKDAFNQIFKI